MRLRHGRGVPALAETPKPLRPDKVTSMRSTPLLLLAVVAALALGACTGGTGTASARPSAAAPTDPANPAGLDGRTFVGTTVAGEDIADVTLIRLAFAGGGVSGSGGCNQMSGSYQVVDGKLVVGAMATTEMACQEPLMAQDAWLAGFLSGATVTLQGDTLTLDKDGTTLTLTDREVAEPDQPLMETAWVLDGIITGDAVSSVPEGVVAGLTMEGGTAAVQAGCNTGSASFEATDTTITFGPMALTRMACESPASDVETAVTSVLSGEVDYAIDAGTLTIMNGRQGLVFKSAG